MAFLSQVAYGVFWSSLLCYLFLSIFATRIFNDVTKENKKEKMSQVFKVFKPFLLYSLPIGLVLSLFGGAGVGSVSDGFGLGFLGGIFIWGLLFLTPKKNKTSSKQDADITQTEFKSSLANSKTRLPDIEYGDSPVAIMSYRNEQWEYSTRPIIINDVFYSYDKDVWYMKAIDKKADKVKTFRLDRVESLEYNDELFFDKQAILKVAQDLADWM